MDRFNNKFFVTGVFLSGIAIVAGLILLVLFVILPFFYPKPAIPGNEPIITNLEVKDLAGIWNNSEILGADWGNRYHFWESGVYSFYFNRIKNPKNRIIGYNGYWKIEKGKIILNPAVEISLSGGNFDERSLNYVGAEITKKETSESRKEIQIDLCAEEDSKTLKCLNFQNEKFYLFSNNASNYYDYKIESEPALKLARNISQDISGNYSYKETKAGQGVWKYDLAVYVKDTDFFGDLKITGSATGINVVTRFEGLPDGKINILFDSYKENESGKLFTRCYRRNCGREAKVGDILFVLERRGNKYKINWEEFYPFVEENKTSKVEFFVKQ